MIAFVNIIPTNLKDKLYFFSLVLMIVSFPFSIAFNSISIGLILLFFLIDIKQLKSNFRRYISDTKNILLLFLFASILLSLTYSSNIDLAQKKVIEYLALIAVPLAMTKAGILSSLQIRLLKRLHVLCCFIAALFCISKAIFDSGALNGSYIGKVAPELYLAYFVHRFTYHELSSHLHLHAIFFSFFIAVSMIFLILEWNSARTKKNIVIAIMLLFFSIVMLLLNSVVINFAFYALALLYTFHKFSFKKLSHHILFYGLSVVSTGIVYYLFLLKNIGEFEQNLYLFDNVLLNRKYFLLLGISLAFAIAIVSIKVFLRRKSIVVIGILLFLSLVILCCGVYQKKSEGSYIQKRKGAGTTNINARFGNWIGAGNIIKAHPILGVGIGDSPTQLVEEYKRINFSTGVQLRLNVHNQYLEFWVAAGLAAILCFSCLLIRQAFLAVVRKNYDLFGLVFLFSIFSVTESTMSSQHGRIFFLFFLCLLSAHSKSTCPRAKFFIRE